MLSTNIGRATSSSEDKTVVEFVPMNASGPPDDDLAKEVYAHFGLCIFLSQVFETGLINVLTALETAAHKKPTLQSFDALYAKHQSFTFGRLLSALSVHRVFPANLIRQVRELKAARDHLAHHFFREHDLDFMSIGGCYLMIEILEGHRDRFLALDKQVSELERAVLSKIGMAPHQLETAANQRVSEMLKEAQARYSSSVADRK
jgi:hypothetical protein